MTSETASAGVPVHRPGLRKGGPLVATITRSTLLWHLVLAVIGGIVLWFVTGQVSAFRDTQLASVGMYAVAVGGLTVLTGINGQVSLGHGALMAVGAYTTALLLKAATPATPPVSTGPVNYDAPVSAVVPGSVSLTDLGLIMIAAVLMTALVGAVVGAAAARLRGPYLAGATLALAVAVPSLADRYTSVFKGDQGLPSLLPPRPGYLSGSSDQRWEAVLSLAAALIMFVLLANLLRSRFGRVLRAVRDDEVAASLAGLHVARLQVLAFVVSAGCAGLAGALIALITQRVSPGGFTLSLSFSLLTAVVLGGLGSLAGAVWGSLALVFLPELSHSFTSHLHTSAAVSQRLEGNLPLAVYGILLIIVMMLAPAGLQGLFRSIGGLVQRRVKGRVPDSP